MSSHFNELRPAEAERLALLLEELGEAQQAIGKILRHGYASYHPNKPSLSNREQLMLELGDVLFAVQFLCDAGDLKSNVIDRQVMAKREKVGRYLHHCDPFLETA